MEDLKLTLSRHHQRYVIAASQSLGSHSWCEPANSYEITTRPKLPSTQLPLSYRRWRTKREGWVILVGWVASGHHRCGSGTQERFAANAYSSLEAKSLVAHAHLFFERTVGYSSWSNVAVWSNECLVTSPQTMPPCDEAIRLHVDSCDLSHSETCLPPLCWSWKAIQTGRSIRCSVINANRPQRAKAARKSASAGKMKPPQFFRIC
jgi:hypothetical protein